MASNGESTSYTYDADDRLRTATTPVGTATYDYYPDGLLHTTQYTGTKAITESRVFDPAGRLSQLKSTEAGALVAEFDYLYDGNGNRSQLTETRGAAVPDVTGYGYDDANRLIGVQYPEETVLYSLDATGNRRGEKKALPGVVAALTVAAFVALAPADASAYTVRQYNAVDWLTQTQQVLPTAQTTRIAYDANGNRSLEGTRKYTWDIRDTLTQVTDGTQVIGTYDYDSQLQRVKADTQDGHVEYVLDGQYVLQETGVRARRYHFGEGNGLAVTDAAGSRWLLNDAQGSTSVEVGSGTTHRKYDAWGNYRAGTTPAATEPRLGYTGHQYDLETGLTYARARYYDSTNGVFLSQDSVEGSLSDAPSLHRYAYAHQNPLRYTDSSGHFANVLVDAAIGAAIGFGVSALTQAVSGDEFSWKKAGAAAAGGAVSGALAGATMGGSLWLEAGGAVASGMAGGTASRALMGEKTAAKDLLIDGAIAGVTFGVVKGIGSASANGQMTAAIKELEKETAKEAAAKAAPVLVREATEEVGAVAATSADQAVPISGGANDVAVLSGGTQQDLLTGAPGLFHPESLAANSTTVSKPSIMRALRLELEVCEPTLKILGRCKSLGRASFPQSLDEAAGISPFGSDRAIVFLDQVTNARSAAGTAAHEVRHIMQKIPTGGAGYSLIHEVDAMMWQSKTLGLGWTTDEIVGMLEARPKLYGRLFK